MRVLICAEEAPLPPTNGFRLHLDHLSRALRERHDVRLVAAVKPEQHPSEVNLEWMRLVESPHRTAGEKAASLGDSMLRRRPLSVRGFDESLGPVLDDELRSFRPDVVHVTPNRLATMSARLHGRPAVLAALDAWHRNVRSDRKASPWLRRLLLIAEHSHVRRFEATEYAPFGRVIVVSEEDARALRELDPRIRVEVIPNGVDADQFAPDASIEREPGLVVFTGVMDYHANVTAAEFVARDVMPRVRAVRADARLALVGRDPRPRVQALAELPGVSVVGSVPELRPWLSRASVYCCPMRDGTGIKNKLLEAMANGVACVVTPLSLGGLRVKDGRELLVGRDADALADAIVRVLADPALAADVGAAGRRYVLEHHTWAGVARAYETVYEELLASPSAPERSRERR